MPNCRAASLAAFAANAATWWPMPFPPSILNKPWFWSACGRAVAFHSAGPKTGHVRAQPPKAVSFHPPQMSLGNRSCHCLGAFGMGADGLQAALHHIVDPSRRPHSRWFGLLLRRGRQHASHVVTMHMLAFFDFSCRNTDRKSVSIDPVPVGNVTNGNLVTEWYRVPRDQLGHRLARRVVYDSDEAT